MAEAIVLHQFCQVMFYSLLTYDVFELHAKAKISGAQIFILPINKKGRKYGPLFRKRSLIKRLFLAPPVFSHFPDIALLLLLYLMEGIFAPLPVNLSR